MRALFVVIFSAAVLAVSFAGREKFREVAPATEDSAEVLEQVPSLGKNPAEARREALRAQQRLTPNDLAVATTLARLEIDVARKTGDPRHLSYAQAALAVWWSFPSPPDEVRALRATILQSSHHFDAALVDLDALVAKNSNDAQARLTRATALAATGKIEAALGDCAALVTAATPLIAQTCRSQALSNAGRSSEAYEALARTATGQQARPELAAWVESTLGEIAMRAGMSVVAEKHFRTSLALDSTDRYTRTAYADLLLSLGRNDAVLALTKGFEEDDALLLRAALAGEATAAATVKERQAASRERGDKLHLREEARFTLRVENKPDDALLLALENWQAQKEHADAVLLLEAAVASKNVDAARPLLAQLQTAGATDPTLLRLAEKLR